MGPRSDERGNAAGGDGLDSPLNRASMGPRSDERGNLFAHVTSTSVGTASMGPRSDERGNVLTLKRTDSMEFASMGPRSDERGNSGKRDICSDVSFCFNGAALR